jgi:hypothetical protein
VLKKSLDLSSLSSLSSLDPDEINTHKTVRRTHEKYSR